MLDVDTPPDCGRGLVLRSPSRDDDSDPDCRHRLHRISRTCRLRRRNPQLPRLVAQCAPPRDGARHAAFPARNSNVHVESPDDPLLPCVPAELHDRKLIPLARRANAPSGNTLLRTRAVRIPSGNCRGGLFPRSARRIGEGNGLPEANISPDARRRRRSPGSQDYLTAPPQSLDKRLLTAKTPLTEIWALPQTVAERPSRHRPSPAASSQPLIHHSLGEGGWHVVVCALRPSV